MESLSHRERLLRTLRHQPTDRLPDFEFGFWIQTLDRWRQEGMDIDACKGLGRPTYYLERYFNTDDTEYGPGLSITTGLLPTFDEIVLEDRGQNELIQDRDGAISEQLKAEYGASIPRYIRHAIQNRADWEKMAAERLDPNHPARIPGNLDLVAKRLAHADYPTIVSIGSLYGWIRNWMGVENLSFMLYDDPVLIEEMMEHVTRLILAVLEKLAGKGFHIDRADWWEDMCYRAGSLLSVRMFRELMVPRYKRITGFLRREFGVEFNQLDCDGNIHQLTPLWLESGINVMFPVEVAHTDVFRLAQEYGTRGCLRGGYDKRALIEGPTAIDAEFERLMPLIKGKLLIPHTDHLVPPDVSFENYLYYRRRKLEIIGKAWSEPGVTLRSGYLQNWQLLGPLDNPANAAFHTAFTPETGLAPSTDQVYPGKNGRQVRWQLYEGHTATGYVDLADIFGPQEWSVAYASGSIYSPTERKACLELGSDDGIQAWLNGEHIWKRDVYRVVSPGQDLIPITIRPGWNTILLKIGQAKGEWGFLCKVGED